MDSVFDIGANVILGWFHRKAKRLDHNKWPVGGSRLETIGNITYGLLLGIDVLCLAYPIFQVLCKYLTSHRIIPKPMGFPQDGISQLGRCCRERPRSDYIPREEEVPTRANPQYRLGARYVCQFMTSAELNDASVVKLILFCYCFALRNKSSQVRMLWEDHRNDLFVSSFGW